MIDRIKKMARAKGWKMSFLAAQLGLSASYFTDVKNGKTKIPESRLKKIAELLDTTPEYLNGETEDPTLYPGVSVVDLKYAVIDHVAIVAAGYSQTADVDVLEKMAVPERLLKGYDPRECKAITVRGDSMYPKYESGDIVIYHVQTSVDSGSNAVIQYNGEEVTVKRVVYRTGEDWMRLEPLNTQYPPLTIEGADLEECRVYGLVIGLLRSE